MEPRCPVLLVRKYRNRELAVAALQRTSKKPAKSEGQVWKCLFCNSWHTKWKKIEKK